MRTGQPEHDRNKMAISRDASIRKMTAEMDDLKAKLAEAIAQPSSEERDAYIDELKRDIHQLFKDIRWVYGMKAIEEARAAAIPK